MKSTLIHIILAVLAPAALLFGFDSLTHQRIGFVKLTAVDAAAGRETFGKYCLRCHNLDVSPFQKLGPNLESVRNREHIVDGKPLTVPQYVMQSIFEPDAYRVPGFGVMPKNVASQLSEDEIRDLIAYISGPAHAAGAAELQIPEIKPGPEQIDITLEESELGEKVLREKGKCTTCHSYYQTPEYHSLAPNLFTGAYKDVEQLKKHIRDPSAAVSDEYKSVRIETVDGVVMLGRRIGRPREDGVRLLTQNAKGDFEIVFVANDQIESDEDGKPLMETVQTSPMPADFAKQLTEAEIDAVAKLISSLNE